MASSSVTEDYKVGIICALPLERTAVEAMLDESHEPQSTIAGDHNVYSFGSIGKHNVVIASLGAGTYGTVSAAGVANDIRRSFPQLKYGLMVGIAGGMPRPEEEDGDIRLGDVVVGCTNGVPSIVNYNLGKDTVDGFDIRSELGEPPEALSRAVAALESQHQKQGPTYLLHLSDMLKRNPRLNRPKLKRDYYNMPDSIDQLFNGETEMCRTARCLRDPPDGLDAEKFVRATGDDFHDYPDVFRGTIGSADTLMKNAASRDQAYERVMKQRKAKLLCFEMEASGIVRGWPCLVIRGICDYCDSHKNDSWQNFAAATAAAYAKDLLLRIPPEAVTEAKPVAEVVKAGNVQNVRISHSGSGSVNTSFGSGSQHNYHQSGSNNRQINAGNITTYNEAARELQCMQ
ncbi:hypothetical protein AMS68_002268 [Peltaster fructicola]|uniref:Uncharacterized protein n=1 Tax=Peltaster fructicola TaxID=286661 RepID=A0A6H0XQ23_9PEZI|nr:hypothetical protein AMS68_002268 [Peltaster fructicola]